MKNVVFVFLRTLLYLLTLVLLLAAVVPYFGRWDWRADLFSHFVPHYAVFALLTSIGLLAFDRRRWALLSLAVFAFQVYQAMPLWYAPHARRARTDDRERITIVQFNGNFANPQPENVVDWILFNRNKADIVVLLEVSHRWEKSLQRLKRYYPHSIVKPREDSFGIGVFSSVPARSLRVEYTDAGKLPMVIMRGVVGQKNIPFVLYAAHPAPPINKELSELRNRDLRSLSRKVSSESTPNKIVIGDMNTTRWSYWFKLFAARAGLRDGQEGFGFQPTWPSRSAAVLLGVPIDHALVSPSVRVVERTTGPDLKSDHLPVVTTVEVPAQKKR